MAITLRALQCFVTVCSTGSISRAATKLHVAQPALSLAIQNFETELGVPLLHRTPRGVTPTAAGSRMLAHAREILGKVDEARADVRDDLTLPRGTVSVAMPTSIAKLLTVPLLRFSLSAWPDVYLKIIEASTGYVPGFVSSGHADLGITFSESDAMDLDYRHVADEELVVVSPPQTIKRASQPLAGGTTKVKAKRITLKELERLPLILPGGQHSLRQLLDRFQLERGLTFNVIAEANAIAQLVQLASAGIANTIVSVASAADEAAREEVLIRRLAPEPLMRPVFLCRARALPASLATLAVAEKITELLTAATHTARQATA